MRFKLKSNIEFEAKDLDDAFGMVSNYFDKLSKNEDEEAESIFNGGEIEIVPILLHVVEKNDNCYYCTICKYASGDGDGLIGKECGGLPPLGFGVGDKAPAKDRFGPPPVKKDTSS